MSQPSLNRMQTTTLLVYESTYLKSYFIITRIKVLQSLCKNHLSLKKVIIRTLLFMLEWKENSEWSRCKDVSLYIMMLKHLHSTCVEQIRFLSLTFLLWLIVKRGLKAKVSSSVWTEKWFFLSSLVAQIGSTAAEEFRRKQTVLDFIMLMQENLPDTYSTALISSSIVLSGGLFSYLTSAVGAVAL